MPFVNKTELGTIDGTPIKRIFWSIISDYDLKSGLCELIDNAIDLWTVRRGKRPLRVDVSLDLDSQFISIQDNAGGVSREELPLLVIPGGSRNEPEFEVIGIFGVGGKRASIALGEHVEIRTRHNKEQTHELDFTKLWLDTDDWRMPLYAIPDISPGTTIVEISRLRKPFGNADIEEIRDHLACTYACFLQKGCAITLNGDPVDPKAFDHWAYPARYSPRQAKFGVVIGNERLEAEITAGLITDRDPEAENYGVYVYCNERLIVKELRTRDVGYYVTAEAGVPHPDASMCRAIVRLQGPVKLMPWNSSKNGINFGHPAFQQLRPVLIRLVSYFSSLSRRLKHDWDHKVTPRTTGRIEVIDVADVATAKKISLPGLPRVNKPQVEHLKTKNRKILADKPWTVGLVEAIACVEVIFRQRLDTKNRIALILLDSNFEIALKEFIVHRDDLFPPKQYPDSRIAHLFQSRSEVIKEVTDKVQISPKLLAKASHYYGLRNKLIHERATVGITDTDIENYRSVVENILDMLFDLRFTK